MKFDYDILFEFLSEDDIQTYGDENLINLFNQLKPHKIDYIMVFEKI